MEVCDQKLIKRLTLIKLGIAREIEYDREFYGWTPEQLSEKTGLSRGDVSELLNGKMERFTLDRLLMILMKLGHDPSVYVTQ